VCPPSAVFHAESQINKKPSYRSVAMIADCTVLPADYLVIISDYIAKPHLQLYLSYWALSVLGLRFDFSGSRDVIGDVTTRFPFPIGRPLEQSLYL